MKIRPRVLVAGGAAVLLVGGTTTAAMAATGAFSSGSADPPKLTGVAPGGADNKANWADTRSGSEGGESLSLTEPGTSADGETADSGTVHEGRVSPGTRLDTGDSIVSPDGAYRLTQLSDGNLALLDGSDRVQWSSQTSDHAGRYAVFEEDGNLVVYNGGGGLLWRSATAGQGAVLSVRDDGTAAIADSSGNEIWNSAEQRHRLYSGQGLFADQYRTSPDGRFTLIQLADGNLVVLNPDGQRIWESQTYNHPGGHTFLGEDGNWVVYNSDADPVWHSATQGHHGAEVEVRNNGNVVVVHPDGDVLWGTRSHGVTRVTAGQGMHAGQARWSPDGSVQLTQRVDGNLVLRGPDGILWTSGTDGHPRAQTRMRYDGNLVILDRHGDVIWQSGSVGHQFAYLLVQNDGNLVVRDRDNNQLVWETGTSA